MSVFKFPFLIWWLSKSSFSLLLIWWLHSSSLFWKYLFFSTSLGAVSSLVISLSSITGFRGGVVLQCESKGWHPQPEVFWLDSEGNLLSAEPTKTVRGPDGLYTVSSRVTVEKRHNNNFTCRVQQNNINQIRETYIIVSGKRGNF